MSKKIAETYATISITDLSLIDFSQIHETSAETIRKSLDGTEFVIKYDAVPTFISDGSVEILQAMNHQEALQLMATDEWSEPLPVE
mgnify:FL=1|tara:strand:+ start:840 stop:1097 length:258 start_codon:yes stop_codon:yes gene_type:complete